MILKSERRIQTPSGVIVRISEYESAAAKEWFSVVQVSADGTPLPVEGYRWTKRDLAYIGGKLKEMGQEKERR